MSKRMHRREVTLNDKELQNWNIKKIRKLLNNGKLQEDSDNLISECLMLINYIKLEIIKSQGQRRQYNKLIDTFYDLGILKGINFEFKYKIDQGFLLDPET